MEIFLARSFVDLGVANTVGFGLGAGSGFLVGNILPLKLLRIFCLAVDLGVANAVGSGLGAGSGFLVGNILPLKLLRIFCLAVDLGVANTVDSGLGAGSGFLVGNILPLKLLRIFCLALINNTAFLKKGLFSTVTLPLPMSFNSLAN